MRLPFSDKQFEEPKEILDDELLETITLDGEFVFSLDCPYGSAGVVRVDDVYFLWCDSIVGPFRDFASALKWSGYEITDASESITCTELTADGVARLVPVADYVSPGYEIEINGEIWRVCDQGSLVRARAR